MQLYNLQMRHCNIAFYFRDLIIETKFKRLRYPQHSIIYISTLYIFISPLKYCKQKISKGININIKTPYHI